VEGILDDKKEQQIMEWYELYYEDIYRFILFMIGDRNCCEDLVHDTFVRAYTSFDRFEKKSTVKTWLFSIARHIVMDEIRRRKRRRIFSFFFDEKELPSTFDVEEYVANREAIEQILEAIQLLKPEYRIVITLKKIEECSTKEISEILGWTDTKVRKTLSRAISALKKSEAIKGGSHFERSI
jgi:RNA polymerase sigma-70 factor, ECF subfamily